MAVELSGTQQFTLHRLYEVGQYKYASVPVAEARAVIGVPQEIEDDESPEGTLPSHCGCI